MARLHFEFSRTLIAGDAFLFKAICGHLAARED
jgi:hypothetical protein